MRVKFLFYLMNMILLVACGGNADNLKEGDPAPEFKLTDAYGNLHSSTDYLGKSPLVVYFYPKANTSGCTKQACGIRDELDKFRTNNIGVLGISVDSRESIEEFDKKYGLNFPLLSDQNKEVSEAYGVLNDLGFANRITFIIDKSGVIRKVIRDVDIDTHAEEVFQSAYKYL